MEVIMGKCFPLDYDFTPAPVVRNIIYKKSDGSAIIKTISEVVITPSNCNNKDENPVSNKNSLNSSNDSNNNCNNRWVSSVHHHNKFDAEKTLSSEHEIGVNESHADLILYQNKLAAQRKLSEESNEMMYIPKAKSAQRQSKLDAQQIPLSDINEVLNKPVSVEVRNTLNKPSSTFIITASGKTSIQEKDNRRQENGAPKNQPRVDQAEQKTKQKMAATIDAEEIKRISSANSPSFRNKHRKETPQTLDATGREAWQETQKRKAQLREEFFRVPYEECNREALRGMLGRLNKSEPRLNTLGKERKKRNSLSDKRRVHFNTDDSQLEDIRRWREERRMQATPQCVKAVAKIYSIDSPPNNHNDIGTISSFSTPKAEMPMIVSIMDSPPMSAKTSKPTDLDSLQGNFSRPKVAVLAGGANNLITISDNKSELEDRQHRFTPLSHLKKTLPSSEASARAVSGNTVKSGDVPSPSSQSSDSLQQVQNSSWQAQMSPQNLLTETTSFCSQRLPLVSTEPKPHESDETEQPTIISGPLAPPRISQARVLQPMPFPRNRSLSSDPSASPLESPSVSQEQQQQQQQQSQCHSVNPVARISYPSRRATSLDPSYRLQPPCYSTENSNSPSEDSSTGSKSCLKSPTLILNHMRNPLPTSSLTETFTPVNVQNMPIAAATTATVSDSTQHISSAEHLHKSSAEHLHKSSAVHQHKSSAEHLHKSSAVHQHKSSAEHQHKSSAVHHQKSSAGHQHKSSAVHQHKSSAVHQHKSSAVHHQKSSAVHQHKSSTGHQIGVPTTSSQDHIQRNPKSLSQSHTDHLQNPAGIKRSYTHPNREMINTTTAETSRYSNETPNFTPAKPPQGPESLKHHSKPNILHRNVIGNKPQIPDSTQSTRSGSETHRPPQPTGKTWAEPDINALPGMKGDSVKILMTRGESYAKHHIVLNSQMNSMSPRVTVRKFPVTDATSVTSPAPKMTSPASTMTSPASTMTSSASPSSSAPAGRSAPSPTPSCASSHCSFSSSGSSSGCFSGSPSPTPTPSPTRVRTSRVPTDL